MRENICKINMQILNLEYIHNIQILIRTKNSKKALNEDFNNGTIRMINKHKKFC